MGFRSRFEAEVAGSLRHRGISFGYETIHLGYQLQGVYTPDFVLPNGVVVEAKGAFSPADRRKMLAVREAHPELDIRLLFQRASARIVGGKLSCGAWATRNGFTWAEGVIPSAWADA
jgi:hypothetical protein